MDGNWINNELETVNLEDKRLNERFGEVLRALGSRPNVSIPSACGGHAETMAAYRFFDNDKIDFDKILGPHRDATEKRISEQEIVLCVQDTTELDLTRPQQQIRGAGLIGTGTNRRGAYLHLLEAFTPDGTTLGAVWAKPILRAEEETRTPEEIKTRQKRLASIPLEEKETFRHLPCRRLEVRAVLALPLRYDNPLPSAAFFCSKMRRPFKTRGDQREPDHSRAKPNARTADPSRCSRRPDAKTHIYWYGCARIEASSKANGISITFEARFTRSLLSVRKRFSFEPESRPFPARKTRGKSSARAATPNWPCLNDTAQGDGDDQAASTLAWQARSGRNERGYRFGHLPCRRLELPLRWWIFVRIVASLLILTSSP